MYVKNETFPPNTVNYVENMDQKRDVKDLVNLVPCWTHYWGKCIPWMWDCYNINMMCMRVNWKKKNMFLLVHFKLVLVRLDTSPKYMSYSGPYYVWHFVCLRIHNSCLFYSLKNILSHWVTSNEHPQRHIVPAYYMPLCS